MWILKGVLGLILVSIMVIPIVIYGLLHMFISLGNSVINIEPPKDYLYYLDLANRTGKVVYWGECPIHPDE